MKLYSVTLDNGNNFIGSMRECAKRSNNKLYPVRIENVVYCQCDHTQATLSQYVKHGKCTLCGGKI